MYRLILAHFIFQFPTLRPLIISPREHNTRFTERSHNENVNLKIALKVWLSYLSFECEILQNQNKGRPAPASCKV